MNFFSEERGVGTALNACFCNELLVILLGVLKREVIEVVSSEQMEVLIERRRLPSLTRKSEKFELRTLEGRIIFEKITKFSRSENSK